MESINRIIITGYLTKEAEHKNIGTTMMSKMQIASERPFANPKTGTTGKETCFVEVEAWGAQSGILRQNDQVIKGTYILAEGKLKLTSWADSNGQKKYKHSIVAERIVNFEVPKKSNADEALPAGVPVNSLTAGAIVDELPF